MKFEPDEKDRFTVIKNDLVICEGGEPGRCAVWTYDETIFFQKALHRVRPFGNISSEYVAFCLWNDALSGTLKKYFTGTGILHFVGEQLKNYAFPLPPIKEQLRIVKKVKDTLLEIENMKSVVSGNLDKSQQLKQSILKRAFEGEL
jgi:type I restriction enzyme S subunit